MDDRTRKLLEKAFHADTPEAEASAFFLKAKGKADLYDHFLRNKVTPEPTKVFSSVELKFNEPLGMTMKLTIPMKYFASFMNVLNDVRGKTSCNYVCSEFDHTSKQITSAMTFKVSLYGQTHKCQHFNSYVEAYINEINKMMNTGSSYYSQKTEPEPEPPSRPAPEPPPKKAPEPKKSNWEQWKQRIFS